MSKRAKGKPRAKVKRNSIQLHHIKSVKRSATAPSVLIIQGHDYTERIVTGPLFERATDPKYHEYVTSVGPFRQVVNLLDKNGEIKTKWGFDNKTGEQVRHKCKAIVVECANDIVFDFSDRNNPLTRFWFDVFIPAYTNLRGTNIMRYDGVPILDDGNPYLEYEYWSDVLSDYDILAIAEEFYCGGEGETLQQFFVQEKEALYSFWREGEVPNHVMRVYGLTEEQVSAKDWDKFQSDISTVAENVEMRKAAVTSQKESNEEDIAHDEGGKLVRKPTLDEEKQSLVCVTPRDEREKQKITLKVEENVVVETVNSFEGE